MHEKRIAALRSIRECEQYMKNVKAEKPENSPELIAAANRRAIQLGAEQHGGSPVERELWEALVAKERHRGVRAQRTRQAIARSGIVAAVDRIVCNPSADALERFQEIVAVGLGDLTFEATIVRWGVKYFGAKAIEKAKQRLDTIQQSI